MKLSQLFKTIDKKEWQFVILIIVVIIVITTLPYIYGRLKTPSDKIYTGIHFLIPSDYPVYYSYIQQASSGNVLFSDLFSAETKDYNILNTIWLLPGQITRLFDLSPALSFQISRILLIPILILVSYLLISYFFTTKGLRKLSLIIFIFASGWGFYYLLFNYQLLADLIIENNYIWPLDFWIIEANTFLTLYYSPHFIASLALLLFSLLLIFLALVNNKIIYALGSGIVALILFSFHPFHFITIYFLPLLYLVIWSIINRQIARRKFFLYSILVLVSLPVIIYYYWLVQTDFSTQIKFLQNYCPTPSLCLVFLGFGAMIIFSVIAVIKLLVKKEKISNKELIIITWFIGQFILVYLPFSFQRRLTEGIALPLALLTSLLLYSWYQKVKSKRPRSLLVNSAVLFFLFLLVFMTTIISQISIDLFLYSKGEQPSYIRIEEFQALNWLKENIKLNEVILAHRDNGNIIPAFSGQRVYLGHEVETIYVKEKKEEVKWFFKENRSLQTETTFLKKRNINYIYYSQEEKSLGQYNPESKPYLEVVFGNDQVIIYQVL